MSFRPVAFTRRHPWLAFVILLEAVFIGQLVYSVQQLQKGVVEAHARGEAAVEMILASYTLRQSSDYLTRFARHYAVTGDSAYRDIYRQVLDIRSGETLRPKDYESVYWDLMEPYRSNAHPLLYPQSLQSILSRLPFTRQELDLLKQAEQQSNALADVETAAFAAVERGDREAAIEALFSVDYLRKKHEIMSPIDEFKTNLRQRVEQERQVSLGHLERQMRWVVVAALLILVGNVVLYLRWPGQPRTPSAQDAGKSALDHA